MGSKMNHFSVLFRFECKKLLGKKIVWISFLLLILISIFGLVGPLLGNYYIDGMLIDSNYAMYQTDKKYAEALNGREINQSLLEETITAYRKIPEIPDKHYTATEEYQKYARPYSEIFNFIRKTSAMQTSEVMHSWEPSDDDLSAKRQQYLMSLWKDMRLSTGEMDFWRERESLIKTPYVYEEHSGYQNIISNYQMLGIFVLLFIAICLSGLFTDEHTRKTDQIVLCSPFGKTMLYWAKITAGITFAAISTILLLAFTFVSTICLYGPNGFQAAFQLIFTQNSDPVTCFQAVLIAFGNMVITTVIVSIIVMVLSEMLQSNIAALAISTGFLILPIIVQIPMQYRVLAQIWDWFPWNYLSRQNVFGQYTISVFGHYFTPWQAVPVIYAASSVLIAAIGKPIYQRFQVSGR